MLQAELPWPVNLHESSNSQDLLLDDMLFHSDGVDNRASLVAHAYHAFCAMLRIDTSPNLGLPTFDAAGNERDIKHFHQMRFEH
jgi:hypothetical protein